MNQSQPDIVEAAGHVNSAYDELCVRFSGVHSDDAMDSVLLRLHAALKKLGVDPTAPYITPAQPAGMREALEKCADYVRARHNANIGWWNDPYAWQTLEHVIKPALALPAERPAVAQRSGDPLAGLDERLDRLCLTSTENNRVFVLATESARNIVDIVREWLRSGAGYSHSSTVREGGK